MKAELQPESFLHRCAFQQYFLGALLLHPSTARHSDAGLGCALPLREQWQKLRAINHPGIHRWHNEL